MRINFKAIATALKSIPTPVKYCGFYGAAFAAGIGIGDLLTRKKEEPMSMEALERLTKVLKKDDEQQDTNIQKAIEKLDKVQRQLEHDTTKKADTQHEIGTY